MKSLKHTTGENPETMLKWAVAGAIAVIIALAYFVVKTTAYGSVASWLMVSWEKNDDYSHGFAIPFIALGLLIYKWRELPEMLSDRPRLGLAVLGVALGLFWVGVKSGYPHFAAVSFIVLLFGLALYFGGWNYTKAAAFPIAFLFFMLPLDFFLGRFTFDLQMFVSTVSAWMLNVMGIDAVRDGTQIFVKRGDPNSLLDVAAPCSGIRSLLTLTALASLFGYLTLEKRWQQWFLFFLAVPLAVGTNVIRIVTVAMISRVFGRSLGLYIHDHWSGFIVFGVAVVCLVGVSRLFNMDFRGVLRHWMSVQPLKRANLAGPTANK